MALLNINHATSDTGLKSQLGNTGLKGGPRTGATKRTTQQTEAYLVRRWLLNRSQKGDLSFPLTVLQGDAPDFQIIEGVSKYGLEITEACAQQDGRERALMESVKGPVLFGSFGGRGQGGYLGDMPFTETLTDIQNAIDRKSHKAYATQGTVDLLIYPNSNPAFFVAADGEEVIRMSEHKFQTRNFRHVYIYWDSENIFSMN